MTQGPYVVTDSVPRLVPAGAERLVVLLALRGSIRRKRVASLLWPAADPHRSAGNLRSAIWRLRSAHLDLVTEIEDRLSIRADVSVDVRALTRATTDDGGRDEVLPVGESAALPLLVAATNLLPGWYDDWLVADRERIRGLALDALDRRSLRLRRSGRWAEAIDAALVAVTCEPLRESSQVSLVRAYLEEGNRVEARRAYRSYLDQLATDAGLDPSSELLRMVTVA